MRTFFLLLSGLMAFLPGFSQNDGRLLDWPMKLNYLSVKVNTDAFTATTFIETEFCNPNDKEIEGLYLFQLEPGQAITAFQLELNGKYRDGSIEEKWKARNAYNTIVGKRVDPALLQMDYANHYRLNIYPIPAKGCRRVTMTIQQQLKPVNGKLVYQLPLNYKDTVKQIYIALQTAGIKALPVIDKGLLKGQNFAINNTTYDLNWTGTNKRVDVPLSFSIPLLLDKPAVCIKQVKEKTFFALRFIPRINRAYEFNADDVIVFWDISASGRLRNIRKEINFLKEYVSKHAVSRMTIVTFNQQVQDTAIFFLNNNYHRWVGYLEALKYEGAVQYGSLDFSAVKADAILLFSHGRNSFGADMPVPGQVHTWCINSANDRNQQHLENIIGFTGGHYIDLTNRSSEDAVAITTSTENILLRVKAGETTIDLNEKISVIKNDTILLTGTLPAGTSSLTLQYGNNSQTREEETIDITTNGHCEMSAIDRLEMLSRFEQYNGYHYYWYDVLNFGKAEKVVTASTSYIVLERIEDYIKFNILPPADLQPECDMSIFVKADEERRRQFKMANDFDVLKSVVSAYNERIGQADKYGQSILLTNEKTNPTSGINNHQQVNASTTANGLTGKVAGLPIKSGAENSISMSEVVVTAMGVTQQSKELSYSVTRIHASELTQAKPVNLQQGLTGKVSGLNVQTVNSGVFGDTRITLRGIRSLTGNNQPMLVLDGSPVSLSFLNAINPNDVSNVTVLKSAAATAIYGPDGVNGALVVSTKKGSRSNYNYYWRNYRLKDMADVDYLQELKHASVKNLAARYEELRVEHGREAAFYFDAAQVFYKAGMQKDAINILYTASAITNGHVQVLEAIAYFLESWQQYDEAIRVYTYLLGSNPKELLYYRGLALAYYQKRDYTNAVKQYYAGITLNSGEYEYYYKDYKAMFLQEMNAVIAAHKDSTDITGIHPQLIRPLHYDLRITVDCNNRNLGGNISVTEPGGKTAAYYGEQKAEGKLSGKYYGSVFYHNGTEEYQLKKAKPGKYRVHVSFYGYYNNSIPSVIRVLTFRNSHNGPVIEIENAMMDNQYGNVEIADVRW
jgi:TonB-dependent SusC/RagA subfamily outer membrane receptor